jgi:HD superfamily phosphohydrolase YqeK
MSADIFISYRGADRVLARKLEYRLRSRWGSRVFRDETGVTSGRNWAKELTDAMQEARVIIALVGPGWHISTDEQAEDWVRKELATAVQGAKPILPVLVGESEVLRPKLSSMPEAFRRQAVVVGPELAGFDLHKIAKALGHLGAFRNEDAGTLAARRDEMIPKAALEHAEQALADGQSLLVVGSSGSGRNALVQRLVENQVQQDNLVATYGVQRGGGPRHTHAVIAGWIKSLGTVFGDLNSPYSVKDAGKLLVKSVLEAGPDLLSRRVVKASTLLPLGGTKHDQMILEAVRRSTDRWAPFPPTRLRHQSRAVLERLLDYLRANQPEESILGDKKLILVVDHFDSVDSISGALVNDLLEKKIGAQRNDVQFIIAAYNAGLNARGEIKKWLASKAPLVTKIDIQDDAGWGDHLQPWLDAHRIELDESVATLIAGETNPYRALAKLWYLVDNGLVTEPPRPRSKRKSAKEKSDGKITWRVAGDGEALLATPDLLTEDRLLDHMVEEHVPVGFRSFVEAGALLGRTFSFHAAYAAIKPPASDETVEQALSGREREKWAAEAREVWQDLKTIDPEGSVFSCTESDSGELLVSFAQADLIGHLRNRLNARTARLYHERLARYLVDPIEEVAREDFGDQYYRADLAAEHWTLAGRPRDAADAHRHAAQLAEISLAYGESRRHYHSAIRLYTQLIAEGRDPTRDHEDLLILANCFYRVGQTTRLSGKPRKADEGQPWGAVNYLERALDRLHELKALLLKNEPDRWPDGITGPCTRGIPGPNLVRHHLRVYNAVSGHVHLELAQCYETAVDQCRARTGDELHSCPECRQHNRLVRDRLFDALRHAEAAQGEAGSRWLLAAASARLAALLTEESLRTEFANSKRSNELAAEAFFHIERIIGLRPYTTEEEQEFADPVSVAWRSAGRLFRHHAREARIAEWCFHKMNDHGANVTASVDLVTDRWLGGFLISVCTPGEPGPTIEHARALLERHRNWVIESGIVDWRTRAHLRLYLLTLVESGADPSQHQARREHLDRAWEDALSDRHRRECRLFQALEEIVSANNDGPDLDQVVQYFREALPELASDGDATVRRKGASRLARMLLRRCPQLFERVQDRLQPLLGNGWQDADVWIKRAGEYSQSLQCNRILSPCIDRVIDRLAKSRLLPKVYHQAIETKQVALQLLEMHQAICTREEGVDMNVLIRDVEYAAFMHDWYCGADPARLLALASEWNLQVSGEEWSNPSLLQGRLASSVLKIMYDAEVVLGTSRYQRITNMVDNCVVGRADASALAKVFFLANAITELRHGAAEEREAEPEWLQAATKEEIDDAYRLAIKQKEQAPWDLGYVQSHAVDHVTESPLQSDTDIPALDEESVLDDEVLPPGT